MALFNIFKKFKKQDNKSRERYQKKEKLKLASEDKASKHEGAPSPSEETQKKTSQVLNESEIASRVLRSPVVTEKSTRLSNDSAYIFRVASYATKPEVKRAVKELYNVRVRSVNVLWHKPKKRRLRGISGYKPGYRKAIVTLEKGQKIELI